jgi:hypothetical protein
MNEEIQAAPVKRPRGNPNFVKKNVEVATNNAPDNKLSIPMTTNTVTPGPQKESEVWLRLYCAVIGIYGSPSPAVCKAAATTADSALQEYNNRYKGK